MSNSTTAALLARIRVTVPEAAAVDWTDATLLAYLNLEYKEWCAALGRLPGPGWFTVDTTFTIPANATTYALSSLLNATTAGQFAAVKALWYLPSSGDPIEIDSASPGQEAMWSLPIGQNPVGQQAPQRRWLTRPAGVPTLNVGPEANVDRLFRGFFRYEPPALTNTGESVQTDSRHDDVLVRGTVLRALEDVGETDDVIERRYQADKIRYLEDERMAAGESCSETTKVVVSDAMFG